MAGFLEGEFLALGSPLVDCTACATALCIVSVVHELEGSVIRITSPVEPVALGVALVSGVLAIFLCRFADGMPVGATAEPGVANSDCCWPVCD